MTDDNITPAPIEATSDTDVAPKPRKPGTGFFRPRTAEEKAAADAKFLRDAADDLNAWAELLRAAARRRGEP